MYTMCIFLQGHKKLCVLTGNHEPSSKPILSTTFLYVYQKRMLTLPSSSDEVTFVKKNKFFWDPLESSLILGPSCEHTKCFDAKKKPLQKKIALYNSTIQSVLNNSANDLIHSFYNSTNNMLLPHLLHQLSKFFFLNGPKVNLFPNHNNNKQHSFIHYMPKGHFPGTKTATNLSFIIYGAL